MHLIIEKIIGKEIPKNVENIIHSVGFLLLIGLLIFITCNDIIKLF